MDTIVVRNHDQLGHGDRALGQRILGTWPRPYPTCRRHDGSTPVVGMVGDRDSIVRDLGRAAKGITS